MGVEVLVPIFGIIFTIGLPMVALVIYIIVTYRKRRRLIELHHAERMAAIERGMELPPLPVELLIGRPTQRPHRTTLLPGLVWFFVGLAVMAGMRPLAERVFLLGLVPTAIGLAYLLYYYFEGRKIEAAFRERELAGRPTIAAAPGTVSRSI